MGSVERLLVLGLRSVAEIAPCRRRCCAGAPSRAWQFDVLDGLPRLLTGGTSDELGLVVAVHGLGQCGRPAFPRSAVTSCPCEREEWAAHERDGGEPFPLGAVLIGGRPPGGPNPARRAPVGRTQVSPRPQASPRGGG